MPSHIQNILESDSDSDSETSSQVKSFFFSFRVMKFCFIMLEYNKCTISDESA